MGEAMHQNKLSPSPHQFQMREHRNNAWKAFTFGLPIPGLSRNILRDATLAGWTDTGNPVLEHPYFCGSRHYEVVRVVRRFARSLFFYANNTCLECRQVGSTQPFVSSPRNPIKLFHLSSESRDWLDAVFRDAGSIRGKNLTVTQHYSDVPPYRRVPELN